MSDEVQQLGKYQVRGELGRGAMGIVYRGFDPFIEREVAIKTLRADLLEGQERSTLLERFRKEAQAAGRLNHPGIVQVYEYGVDGDRVFIAMELIRGVELRDYMRHDARFSLDDIIRIMGELLDALAFAHANGVVHRDIKPSNIVVLENGRIKVTDFGIARLESSNLTQAGSMLGTPSYMSPEQFMAQRVDGRSDLFSAGVVLYELLTGEKPFAGNSFATIMHKVLKEPPTPPSELNITVPPRIDAVVLKALSKRPDERYQDATAFKQALNASLAGTAETPPSPTPSHQDGDATLVLAGGAGVGDATVLANEPTVLMGGAPPLDATVAAAGMADATRVIGGAGVPDMLAGAERPETRPVAGAKGLKMGGAVAVLVVLLGGAVFFLRQPAPEAPAVPAENPVLSSPPAQAVASGVVRVDTDPSGAVVIIDDGRFGGVSPARLELPVGTYRIQLKKEGYHDLEASVEVARGGDVPFQVSLTPLQ